MRSLPEGEGSFVHVGLVVRERIGLLAMSLFQVCSRLIDCGFVRQALGWMLVGIRCSEKAQGQTLPSTHTPRRQLGRAPPVAEVVYPAAFSKSGRAPWKGYLLPVCRWVGYMLPPAVPTTAERNLALSAREIHSRLLSTSSLHNVSCTVQHPL